MPNHRRGDIARGIVKQARVELKLDDADTSISATNALIDAVEENLTERDRQAKLDEARLATLEDNGRLLASAVVAITEAVQHPLPAVVALKTAMPVPDVPPASKPEP